MDQQSSSMVGDYAPFDLPEPDGRVRRAFILDRKQPLRAEHERLWPSPLWKESLREAEYHDGAMSIRTSSAVI
jgi:hypothetical protein